METMEGTELVMEFGGASSGGSGRGGPERNTEKVLLWCVIVPVGH